MFTAQSLYGTQPQVPSAGLASVTEPMGVSLDDRGGIRGLIDPSNPLVWFGGFLLVTVGAAGVSGSARLGRAKVAASVGSTG
jgi:hypothetical protein